jgi:polyhydroxybutyrate depolymerase
VRCGWNSALPGPGGCDLPVDPSPDDAAFAGSVSAWAAENLCLDPRRLFTAGFSNGGALLYRLYCEQALARHGYAAFATAGAAASAAATPGGTLCRPAARLASLSLCGAEDGCFAEVEPQLGSFARWANCTGAEAGQPPARRELSSTSACLVARGCPRAAPAEACVVQGLSHCWPAVPGGGEPACPDEGNGHAASCLVCMENHE